VARGDGHAAAITEDARLVAAIQAEVRPFSAENRPPGFFGYPKIAADR